MNIARWIVGILVAASCGQAFSTRPQQALEAYNLADLKIRQIYLTNHIGSPYATVEDPGGYLHRVFKNDYVGRNYGRVIQINANGIRVREVVQDAQGEWKERPFWWSVDSAEGVKKTN